MSKIYTPQDWYWVVAGSLTQVYASARRQYVPVADATFVAWNADGTRPSRVGTENELREVLADYGIGFLAEKPAVVFDRSALNRVIFEAFFDLENRVRVLEGRASITRQQLLTGLRNLVP